jgi:hypothetical protein
MALGLRKCVMFLERVGELGLFGELGERLSLEIVAQAGEAPLHLGAAADRGEVEERGLQWVDSSG